MCHYKHLHVTSLPSKRNMMKIKRKKYEQRKAYVLIKQESALRKKIKWYNLKLY